MNKDLQKLARETAVNLAEHGLLCERYRTYQTAKDSTIAIILSALEKAIATKPEEHFGLCLSHRAAYRLAKPEKCPICRLLEENSGHLRSAAHASERKEGDAKCELTDGLTQQETSTHIVHSKAAPTFKPKGAAHASEEWNEQ